MPSNLELRLRLNDFQAIRAMKELWRCLLIKLAMKGSNFEMFNLVSDTELSLEITNV